MTGARIKGTGSYTPERVISNRDLEGMVETSDEWISMRTGIRERRVSEHDTTTVMAVNAGRRASEASGISASEIDLASHIHSDGRRWEMLYVPGAIGPSPFEKRAHVKPHLKMQGNETFKVAVRTIESALKEVMKTSGLRIDDVSLLIPVS